MLRSMHTRRPARSLFFLLAFSACGADPQQVDDGTGSAGGDSHAATGTPKPRSDAGAAGSVAHKDAGTTNRSDGGASAAGSTPPSCKPDSLNQTGCSCDTQGEMRACYTGPAATRRVGACRDGVHKCVVSGEFGTAFTACSGEVLPDGDSCTVTAPPDAGLPPGCKVVQGFGGNGQLADGTLFCEDDVGAGLGDLFGSLFGGGADAGYAGP